MNKLKKILEHFAIDGDAIEIDRLGDGLINDTFRVSVAGGRGDYVLQRINHNVFKDVDGMQRNIEAVTDHIKRKLSEGGEENIERKTLQFVKTRDSGKTYFYDGDNYWRVSKYIDNAITLQEVTPATARFAGEAFGRFQKMLCDIDGNLKESIPDFHNMEFRLAQLKEAIENNPVGRADEVKDLLEKVRRREEWMTTPERMYREGILPKRICHCDTKVNNMLFDDKGDVLCVIDLDTVMPSFVFSDYGDFLRTAACTSAEDEKDLDKIAFRMDIFKAFNDGYLSEARSFLSQAEIDWLPDSVALFPFMQGVRFLTDYINGDTYYKISYPTHNLVRARAQFRLLEKVEEALPQLREAIEETIR